MIASMSLVYESLLTHTVQAMASTCLHCRLRWQTLRRWSKTFLRCLEQLTAFLYRCLEQMPTFLYQCLKQKGAICYGMAASQERVKNCGTLLGTINNLPLSLLGINVNISVSLYPCLKPKGAICSGMAESQEMVKGLWCAARQCRCLERMSSFMYRCLK